MPPRDPVLTGPAETLCVSVCGNRATLFQAYSIATDHLAKKLLRSYVGVLSM